VLGLYELTVSFLRHMALVILSSPRGIISLPLLLVIFVEPWTSYTVSLMLLHLFFDLFTSLPCALKLLTFMFECYTVYLCFQLEV
jgi:hypothetical protein